MTKATPILFSAFLLGMVSIIACGDSGGDKDDDDDGDTDMGGSGGTSKGGKGGSNSANGGSSAKGGNSANGGSGGSSANGGRGGNSANGGVGGNSAGNGGSGGNQGGSGGNQGGSGGNQGGSGGNQGGRGGNQGGAGGTRFPSCGPEAALGGACNGLTACRLTQGEQQIGTCVCFGEKFVCSGVPVTVDIEECPSPATTTCTTLGSICRGTDGRSCFCGSPPGAAGPSWQCPRR